MLPPLFAVRADKSSHPPKTNATGLFAIGAEKSPGPSTAKPSGLFATGVDKSSAPFAEQPRGLFAMRADKSSGSQPTGLFATGTEEQTTSTVPSAENPNALFALGAPTGNVTAGNSTASPTQTRPAPKSTKLELSSDAKIVVVDDTPINVKVLVKMLTKAVPSSPIVSCFDGQSAIDAYTAAAPNDKLLFLMDWHMPGICGLSATESIRKLNSEGGNAKPRVYVIMVTADAEGLEIELENRNVKPTFGNLIKGNLIPNQNTVKICCDGTNKCTNDGSSQPNLTSDSSLSLSTSSRDGDDDEDDTRYTVLDIVAQKPINFKSINALLSWFHEQP